MHLRGPKKKIWYTYNPVVEDAIVENLLKVSLIQLIQPGCLKRGKRVYLYFFFDVPFRRRTTRATEMYNLDPP